MGANLSRLPLWLGFGLRKGSSKNVRQAIVFVLFHPLAGLQGGSFELRVNGKPACWAELVFNEGLLDALQVEWIVHAWQPH